MVGQFGYLGYKVSLLEGISGLAQAAQADLQKQSKQISRAFEQSKGLLASGPINEKYGIKYLASDLKGSGDILNLKGLEVLRRSPVKPLKLSRLSLELQLNPHLRSNLSFRKSPPSKPRQSLASPIAPSQAPSLPQKNIPRGHSQTVRKKTALRSNTTLQGPVLIAIYKCLQCSQEQFIKWNPSAWFGRGSVSDSNRSSWSRALRKLVKKGLVQEHYPNGPKPIRNPGNVGTFVSLTPKGNQEARLLMNNG